MTDSVRRKLMSRSGRVGGHDKTALWPKLGSQPTDFRFARCVFFPAACRTRCGAPGNKNASVKSNIHWMGAKFKPTCFCCANRPCRRPTCISGGRNLLFTFLVGRFSGCSYVFKVLFHFVNMYLHFFSCCTLFIVLETCFTAFRILYFLNII